MPHILLLGALAGYGIAMPVGAIAVLIVGLAARVSLPVGAAAGLGAATADGVYALIAVAGGAALSRAVAPFAGGMRLLAAAVLLALAVLAARGAWRAWRDRHGPAAPAAEREGREGLGTPRRAYLAVLGLTLLNPATLAYYSALVLGAQIGARLSPLAAGGFVLAALVASASWQLLLAIAGSAFGRVLTGTRGRAISAAASSLIMLGFAADLLISAGRGPL